MPGFVLNTLQIRSILNRTRLPEPIMGSPLRYLPPNEHPLHPDDPYFVDLIEHHVLEPTENGWRVNMLFASALQACVEPEEVISIGIARLGHPGYAVARRGSMWCECTVNRDGLTKFYFPLSRSTLILSLTSSLSGDTPEPESTGFRFVGPAEDAFVLSTVMRELREYPTSLSRDRLRNAVARAAVVPGFAAPFTTTVGSEPIERLAKIPEAMDAAIGRLVIAGYLRAADGTIVPSETTAEALSGAPGESFGVTRTEISETGAATQTLMVIKVGDRKLVFRVHHGAEGDPQFEWTEMNRQQIRLLVTAMLLPVDELKQATVGSKDPVPPPAPSEAKAAHQERVWFYIQDRQRCGPVNETEIKRRFTEGELDGETFVWNETMADWKKAAEVGLSGVVTAPIEPPPMP